MSEDPFGKEPPLLTQEELLSWILFEDEHLIVFNKPGWVVCHPSKNGPWSSLAGAVREYTRLERIHLISRLDRETSGLVLFAKHRKMARICQMAIEGRQTTKYYQAIVEGDFKDEVLVDEPIGKDNKSSVHVKQAVRYDWGTQKAKTLFKPVKSAGGYSQVEVELLTGRKHQIRVHAQWLGHSIVGDKLYGPDETLYLDFIEHGWTERMESVLPLKRQALHASEITFHAEEFKGTFKAPLAVDMASFWAGLA